MISSPEIWRATCEGAAILTIVAAVIAMLPIEAHSDDFDDCKGLITPYVPQPPSLAGCLKLAEKDDIRAEIAVGITYATGVDGYPKNPTEGAKFLARAAEQGNALAQALLSGLYMTGTGVPQDDVLSYTWAELASSGVGWPDSAHDMIVKGSEDQRKDLAARMTPEQIAKAKQMAAAWKPKSAP